MVGAILGGIGSIAGAFMGASASAEANETNWKINLLNYYQREAERRERIRQGRQNREDQMLGATDAMGNRTRFIEGQGWVTELSDPARELSDAQLAEQMAVLTQDLPQRRERMQKNLRTQDEEEYMAQGFMDELRNVQREDPRTIEGAMLDVSTRGINESHDAASAPLLRTALRTGASNIGHIVSGVAKSRSDAITRAMQDARLKSIEVADNNFNTRRNNAAQLYNMFAERAGRMPDVSYQPQNPGGASANNLSQFASLFANSGSELAQAFGAKGGELDYVQPDYGMANALTTAGGALGGMFEQIGAQRGQASALDNAFDYYGLDKRRRRNSGSF